MNNRSALIALALLASACVTHSNRAADGLNSVEQAEPQYPFGGFLFTGSSEALGKLRHYGEGLGLKFSAYPESPTQPALLLPADLAFGKMEAVRDLVNRSQAGTFGEVHFGLISEPSPQP